MSFLHAPRTTKPVTPNLFRGPSCLTARTGQDEKWALKQVQGDDEGEGRA